MNWQLVLALILVGSVCSAQTRAKTESDPLIGLWGVEQTYGPLARGALIIDGRANAWHAQISGFDVSVTHGKEISFSLPDGEGKFRGHLAENSKTILGQWIQPKNEVLLPMDCCDVGYQPYVTPVKLTSVEPGVWRGKVVPLDDDISLYVLIQRDERGSLSAIVNNPEFGWGHRQPFSVTVNDGHMTFSNDRQSFEGKYDSENDRLVLQFFANAPPLFLTRRKENAVGFFPRTPAERNYSPQIPAAEHDGWAVGSLKEAGLDPRPISELVEKILTAGPQDDSLNIPSLLIARHGRLVLEEYFYGFSPERTHDTRSAGKTFRSHAGGTGARSWREGFSGNSGVFALSSVQAVCELG